MEFQTRVSIVKPIGGVYKDITRLAKSCSYNRVRNGKSDSEVVIADKDQPFFSVIHSNTWGIRFEAEYSNGNRELTWEGPIINIGGTVSPKIMAQDRSYFWAKQEISRGEYAEADLAYLAEAFLKDNLSNNALAVPTFLTEMSGISGSLDIATGQLVSDGMDDLEGLTYCFIGKKLHLFGTPQLVDPKLSFADKDWVEVPNVEDIGTLHANAVLVKGTRVIGRAESEEARTEGVVWRRFERPSIRSQEAANAAAESLLEQTLNSIYINVDSPLSVRMNKNGYRINNFIPGTFAKIISSSGWREVSGKFLLNKIQVDGKANTLSASFVPYARATDES